MASYQSFEEKRVWDTCPDGGFWTEEPHVALQYNTKIQRTCNFRTNDDPYRS